VRANPAAASGLRGDLSPCPEVLLGIWRLIGLN